MQKKGQAPPIKEQPDEGKPDQEQLYQFDAEQPDAEHPDAVASTEAEQWSEADEKELRALSEDLLGSITTLEGLSLQVRLPWHPASVVAFQCAAYRLQYVHSLPLSGAFIWLPVEPSW